MCPTFGVQFNNLQTTFPYTHTLTCFDYNENGQLIAQHQWKVPSKEENARNGLPEIDWRDAQYDMLYLPVTETVRYHYDFNSNLTHSTDQQTGTTWFEYDKLGRIIKWR